MTRFLKAAFAILFATPALADPVAQTMRNWWLECDPQAYCIGEVNGFAENFDGINFRLERAPQPDSPIYVALKPEHPLITGTTIRFDVLGVASGISGHANQVTPDNTTVFAEPIDSALIDAMRTGNDIIVTIDFGADLGLRNYKIPLAGAVDALVAMDVVQQRLGRVDAAVARGPMPSDSPSDLFPAINDDPDDPGTDRLSDTDFGDSHMEEGPNGSYIDLHYSQDDLPSEVLMPGYRVANCGDLTAPIGEVGALVNRDETARLTYLVPCNVGQANVAYYVVVNDPGNEIDHEFFEFQLPPTMNKPDRIRVLNPVWDPAQNTMTLTRFGNINRNCGAYELHRWSPAQKRFELSQYREKSQCDGPMTRPQDFPLVWENNKLSD